MLLILSLVVLIFSIIIHEVAHGYAADSLGDPTARLSGRLTLNPIPHIDIFGSIVLPGLLVLTSSPIFFGWAKPVPYNPYNLSSKRWGESFVAIAGSATNILIAVIFGLIVRYATELGLGASAVSFAATIALVNLFLGLFNLIPFPPLDGFTALRGALPWHLSSRMHAFEERVRSSGLVALVLFLLAFSYLFAGPFYSFVAALFSALTGGAF